MACGLARIGVAGLSLVMTACGSLRTDTGLAPQTEPSLRVTLHLFHSERGDLRETRTLDSGPGTQLTVTLSDLAVAGTDLSRAAVFEHVGGGRLGRFVASTRQGLVAIPGVREDRAYDIVLMAAKPGNTYECLDYCPACYGIRPARYASFRVAGGGETVRGFEARAGSVEPFRLAASLMSAALRVPGLLIGELAPTGGTQSDLLAVWADIPASGYGYPEAAIVSHRYADPASTLCPPPGCAPGWTPYEANLRYAAYLALHEFAHTYLSAPDYDARPGCASGGSSNLTCMLVQCPTPLGATVTLSQQGADALRYWALMNIK